MTTSRQIRKVSVKNAQERAVQERLSRLDALDPRRIGAALPSTEHEYKVAEKMSDLCDDTKRRGAGGVKAGLVGILPAGRSAFADFHETFTRETEKKAPESKLIDPRKGGVYKGPTFKTISFPETFCILCMRKDVGPSKAGCIKKNCFCCPMLDITPLQESIDKLGLLPGDVIRSTICPQCKIEIMTEMKDGGSGLTMVSGDITEPLHLMKSRQRYKWLKTNVRHVLESSRLSVIEGHSGMKAEGIGTA